MARTDSRFAHRTGAVRCLSTFGCLLVLGLVSLTCLPSPLHAQDVRAVVLEFEGRYAAQIRREAVRALQGEVDLVPQSDFLSAVDSLETDDDYAAAAAETGVSAILGGEVQRRRGRVELTLTLRGGDGEVIREVSVDHRNPRRLARMVRSGLWSQMGDDIQGAPAPEAVDDDDDEDEVEDDDEPDYEDVRVIMLPFEGPEGDDAYDAVMDTLEDAGFEVEEGEADDADERAELAEELGARALVGGEVEEDDGDYVATVMVFDGANGEELDRYDVEGSSRRDMEDELEGSIGPLTDAVMSGAAPEGDEEDEDDEEEEEEDDGPSGPRPSPLQVFTGLRIFNRDFSYSDDLAVVRPDAGLPGLRAYSLPAGPALEIDAVFYPAAFATDGFLANLGLEGGLVYAFGIESEECRMRDAGGQCTTALNFPTSYINWHVGVRARFQIDAHELYGRVGYSGQSFRIDALDLDNPAPEVPDIDYGIIRLAVGSRLVFEPIVVEPRVGFLIVAGSGQISDDDWFPNASALGFEAGLRIGYILLDWLEVMGSFDFQQFGFSMNNEAGDNPNRVAGGATDRYISGTLGLQARLPGD